ncbi:FAD-dependent thiol oxidase [Panus rudis PR-1116 ss-1]|nr:FAD-dependent thiol oxidase [Panus rudis PR-1116 ss-1]
MLSRFTKAFLLIILTLFLLGSLTLLHPPSRAYINPWTGDLFGEGGVEQGLPVFQKSPTNDATHVSGDSAAGGVIMGKLGNATAKAELGRATWKLLHTMTLRFPEDPTEDERNALSSYFYLLSRLYPCGECAQEFQQLLKRFPPQTSSRRAAATCEPPPP